MRIASLIASLVSLTALTRAAHAVPAGNPIGPASRVWFTGASNIRHFTCNAKRVDGALDLREIATTSPSLSGANVTGAPSISVSVARLDCGIGLMNRHLREALQGGEHPAIEFRLATYAIDLMTAEPVARISGQVTVAGVARPVTTTVALHVDTLGALHVRGNYVLRPTEFGVDLPRRFGGLIKVRDRITVYFDVLVDSADSAIEDVASRVVTNPRHQLDLHP